MAQTKEGALKQRETILEKYGENYWKEMGRLGGQVKSPRKGFGTDNRTLLDKMLGKEKRAVVAGRRGGAISKRTRREVESI